MSASLEFVQRPLPDVPEDELVRFLLASPYWRWSMFQFEGIPKDFIDKQRVLLNTAPGGNFLGDADILLCGPGQPERTVAYQVKRVKVGRSQLRFSAPSRLGELQEAVRQANLLAKVGFWKAFLYVITVVDSRELNQGRMSYEGLPNDLKYKITSAVSRSVTELSPGIGLAEIDLTQAMDNSTFTIDSSGTFLQRPAIASLQSEELTRWVEDIFRD